MHVPKVCVGIGSEVGLVGSPNLLDDETGKDEKEEVAMAVLAEVSLVEGVETAVDATMLEDAEVAKTRTGPSTQ